MIGPADTILLGGARRLYRTCRFDYVTACNVPITMTNCVVASVTQRVRYPRFFFVSMMSHRAQGVVCSCRHDVGQ